MFTLKFRSYDLFLLHWDTKMLGIQTDISVDRNISNLWQDAVVATTNLLKIFGFPAFFDSAASSLAGLLASDGAALIVHDGPNQLRYRLFHGMEFVNQEAISEFQFPADQGTVGHVLTTGKHLFTQNYQNSTHAMPAFIAAGLKSNLVVPLPGPTGFVGALAISWINRPAAQLEPATLHILEMFAALIGSSVYRESLEQQLEILSLRDPLTGLPNRRMLMERLAEAQRRSVRQQSLMVIAVLDLDGFKRLNDIYGHSEGDKMLVWAATRIRETIRSVDMVVRLGGDEFVIIFEDVKSLNETKMVLQRVIDSLRVSIKKAGVADTSVDIRASLGATVYPLDHSDPDTLLLHGDETMYKAKRAGGDRFLLHAEIS